MKIVLVHTFFYPESRAGATNYVYELAKALQEEGHQVAEFCGAVEPFGVPRAVQEGIEVYRAALPRKGEFASRYSCIDNPRVRDAFGLFLSEENPDVVHLHSLQGLGATLVQEAKSRGIPVVVTFHDGWWICPARFFFKHYDRTVCTGPGFSACVLCQTSNEGMQPAAWAFLKNVFFLCRRRALMKKMLRLVDAGIVSSREYYGRYRAADFPSDKLIISSCGIDTRRFPRATHPFDPLNIRLGFLGGFSEVKGYPLLLQALRLVRGTNYSLHIWGDVAHKKRAPAEERGGKIVVHHLYGRQESAEVFAGIDVLLVPSLMLESWSLAISEAFASGIPVIAVAAGAIPERIQEGETGLLFRHNDPVDLAEKIDRVLADPALLDHWRARIETGKDIRAQAQEIAGIYRKVIAA